MYITILSYTYSLECQLDFSYKMFGPFKELCIANMYISSTKFNWAINCSNSKSHVFVPTSPKYLATFYNFPCAILCCQYHQY